jgi:hypothetical protein
VLDVNVCIKLLFNLKYLCFIHLIFMEHWVEVSWLSIAYNAHLSHVKVTFAWDDDFVHAIQVKITNYMSNVHLLFMRRLGLFFFFFCLRTNFWQISTWKYDFNLSERHYSEKNRPNLPDFEEFFPNFQIFMISIAKNMNGFCFVSTFISSM